MKYVEKGEPPRELIAWAAVNAGLPTLEYGCGNFPHAIVHKALIGEQGNICAYTMRYIDEGFSHVEHLKPQAVSRDEGKRSETADYRNIVACFPHRHSKGAQSWQFGAIFRADRWNSSLFLLPTNPACEKRIRFSVSGEIAPARSNDSAAIWTIDTLGLADPILTEWRRSAIEGRGLSLTAEKPASRGEAERILADICKRRDKNFHPYCVAIKHAAEEYLRIIAKNAKRKKHARAAQKRARQ